MPATALDHGAATPLDGTWRGARWGVVAIGCALAGFGLAAAAVLGYNLAVRFDSAGLLLLLVWLIAAAQVLRTTAQHAGQMGPGWAWAALLVALALGLRTWSASLNHGVSLGADPMNYTNLAQAVLDGRGLITDDWRYGDNLRAYFPPLYPLALAGFWSLFGASTASTLAMNTLFDLAAAWALSDAARRLGIGRIAPAIALVYLAWPAFALAAGIPQKESLTVMLVILLLRTMLVWLGSDAAGRRRPGHGMWLGAWWGLLCLTQPSLALAPVAVALVLWPRVGLAALVRLGLVAGPALLLVLVPWWLRNALVLGAFVPFTSASGMMLNSALNDLRAPFPHGLFALPEHERGAIMVAKAREIIASDPFGALGRMLRNIAVGFAYEEASLARFRHTSPPIGETDHARLFPVLQGSYLALLVAALGGVWAIMRTRDHGLLVMVLLALLLSMALINPWFEFGERHRLILTPFYLLLAACWWSGRTDPARAR